MNINAKRAWIISDTHFGVRNNSKEWMGIIEDYFFNFFIPLLKKESKPGDILIHCGDTFDSRQSINLFVMNRAQDIIESLAEILPVYIIIGNHDIFMKHTNEINSMKLFKHTKNVTVFENPQMVNFGKSTGMFLPWIEEPEELKEFVQNPKNGADLLFCHTDVRGVSFSRNVKVEEGNDAEVFNNYRQVYSGHIHYTQKYKNIRMVGSPYQLTRSDAGNTKSIWLIDLETLEEQSWENTYSPKFLRYRLEWLLEQNIDTIQKLFENNYIDIHLTSQWSLKFPFAIFTDKLNGYRKINHIIITEDDSDKSEQDNINAEENSESISILKLIETYVDGLGYSSAIKEKLLKTGISIYHDVLKDMEKITIC